MQVVFWTHRVDKTWKGILYLFQVLQTVFLTPNRVKGAKHRPRPATPLTRTRKSILEAAPERRRAASGGWPTHFPAEGRLAGRMTPDEGATRQERGQIGRNPKGAQTGLPPWEQPPDGINRIGRKAAPERGERQGARGAAGGKTGGLGSDREGEPAGPLSRTRAKNAGRPDQGGRKRKKPRSGRRAEVLPNCSRLYFFKDERRAAWAAGPGILRLNRGKVCGNWGKSEHMYG